MHAIMVYLQKDTVQRSMPKITDGGADIQKQIQSPGMESIYCRNKLYMSKDSHFIEIFFD